MIERNKKAMEKLITPFRGLVERLITELEKKGYEPIITDGYRTLEEQKELYAQGRTKPGKIVTQTLDSKHCKGEAVDIGFLKNGKLCYDIDWEQFSRMVEDIKGLDHGYRMWGWDKPHVQFNEKEYLESNVMELTGSNWLNQHFPAISRGTFTEEQCEFFRLYAKKIQEWSK